MSTVLLTSICLALCVKISDRTAWLKKRPLLIGLFFGILCVAVRIGSFCLGDADHLVGIQDVPAMIAAFFFGPWAGLIAGGVACAACTLFKLSVPFILADGTAFATLAVAGYAAIMEQWVFEQKRPPFIPVAITAFFGSIFHFIILFTVGICLSREARALEILSDSYPTVPIGAACTAGLVVICTGIWQGWKKNVFNSLTFSLLFLGISFLLIQEISLRSAERQTHAAILAGVNKLETQYKDQIDYSLHVSAETLMRQLPSPENCTMEMLQKYASHLKIDEINVVSANGKLLASNFPINMKEGTSLRNQRPVQAFFQLTNGKRNFVTQNFRPSTTDPENIMKYIGIPFPDRTAFLQLGFSYQRLLNDFPAFFFPMFSTATIEGTGFFIITDRTGKIMTSVVHHPNVSGKYIFGYGMGRSKWETPLKQFFETKLFGVYGQCYRCTDLGKWRIYAFLPYAEFYTDAVRQICIYSFILFMVCISFRLAMVRIARAQKKMDDMRAADLELAAAIQNSELPERNFEKDSCRIQASMTPAKEVGGDFYDHYELTDGRIAVTIADVAGKGIPAAIFMMKAKNILKSRILLDHDLSRSVMDANAELNKDNDAAMFVTAWIGLFQPSDGTLEYVSAGHNPPLIRRENGSVEWLNQERRQKPLAAFPNSIYRSSTVLLNPGDTLFLYTDGVTEAMNPKNELWGTQRLEESLRENREDQIGNVADSLKKFTASAPVADDITMLTLEVKK